MTPLLAIALMGAWSGTFQFDAPVYQADGTPYISGTVNIQEPGVPVYPVKTIFVPVPHGVEPVLEYTASSGSSALTRRDVPRAGVLTGQGLEARETDVPPEDRSFSPVELRGVFPIAGTSVAVVDIHPLTHRGFSPTVSVSLEWNGGGGQRIPAGHLLDGLAQGEVYWPDPPERSESPFWGKPWARIAIEETGPYAVTCQELMDAGCPVEGVPVGTLALYSGPGTMFDDDPQTEHQLQSVASHVEDLDANGLFDGNDRILFLAGGLNRFEYEDGSLEWLWHRYATHRVYWLTWGGESGTRMAQVQSPPDGSTPWGSTVVHRIHLEDGGHWLPRWENRTGWFWRKISSGDQESIPIDIHDAAGAGEVTLAFAVTEATSFTVSLQGAGEYQGSGYGSHLAVFQNVNLASASDLVLGFDPQDPDADMMLDYIEITYPAEMTGSSERLFFPGYRGRYDFTFAGGGYAFDSSDLMNPVIITGTQGGGGLSFSWDLSDSTSLMVPGSGSWQSPDSISPADPGRLVGTITSGDRLLVVPETFTDDALALEALLVSMGLSVVTATTGEIYDEFGQGVKDPGAIRSAVRWGMDSWTQPLSGVILCGDGHYDPLGYSTTIPDLVPAQIYLRNDTSYPAWASEDWFAQVHENAVYPEIPVARIPAGSPAAFGAVVAKTSMYHSLQAGGSWAGRFVLFADDEWGGYSPGEEEHTEYMEEICYSHLPAHVKPEKFYLIEYPWPQGTTPDGVHPEKPQAREAFIDLWNRGMGVMLFFGHGSANQMAHEKVFLGDDPGSLQNSHRLPLAMFFSCDLSRFFAPGVDCIGEKVVYHPGGGAVASIGATGGTTAPANFAYASMVVDQLTGEGNSMGYSFWAGKIQAARAGNSSYYVYLGVPDITLMMADPRLAVTLQGDTLFSGEINSVQGEAVSPDGLALLEITESDIPWQYTMLGGGTIDYHRQGGTAWRGRAALNDSRFSAECIIPYSCATGDMARIDGAAVVASGIELGADAPVVLVRGTQPDDYQGPEISMWVAGQQDVAEPVVTGEGLLEAELSDPSGINFLGRTGNGIRLFVDSEEYDVSHAFSYNTGSTTTGQLQYTVGELSQGEHRFILRGMDGAGNISTDTLYVTSTEAGEVAIQQHIVYPNPGSGTRCFSFSLSSEAHVTVSIFTTAGRRIQSVSRLCSQGYNQIIWNGLDADGDIPASGAYIYRIEAQTESGLFSRSSSVTGVLATVN